MPSQQIRKLVLFLGGRESRSSSVKSANDRLGLFDSPAGLVKYVRANRGFVTFRRIQAGGKVELALTRRGGRLWNVLLAFGIGRGERGGDYTHLLEKQEVAHLVERYVNEGAPFWLSEQDALLLREIGRKTREYKPLIESAIGVALPPIGRSMPALETGIRLACTVKKGETSKVSAIFLHEKTRQMHLANIFDALSERRWRWHEGVKPQVGDEVFRAIDQRIKRTIGKLIEAGNISLASVLHYEGPLSTGQIAELTGLDTNRARYHINKELETGLIEVMGPPQHGRTYAHSGYSEAIFSPAELSKGVTGLASGPIGLYLWMKKQQSSATEPVGFRRKDLIGGISQRFCLYPIGRTYEKRSFD